jgi:hypothetical protein
MAKATKKTKKKAATADPAVKLNMTFQQAIQKALHTKVPKKS